MPNAGMRSGHQPPHTPVDRVMIQTPRGKMQAARTVICVD